MSINTNIYGASSTWVSIGYSKYHTDENLRVYTRENPNGSYNTTPWGEPIDKSVACSGLGPNSALSHLRFFETNAVIETTGTYPLEIQPNITEKRSVTNWCFCFNETILQPGSWNLYDNALVDGDTESYNANPTWQRYSPEPVLQWHGIFKENSANIQPFTQFSHKNLVILIRVTCTSDFTNYYTYDLKTYITNHTTNYPYIVEVSGELYTLNSGTEPELNNSRQQLIDSNNYPYNQVAILDNLQLPETEPYMYGILWSIYGRRFKIMGPFPYSSTTSGGSTYNVNTSGHGENTPNKYIGFCGTDAWKFYKYGSNGSDAPEDKLKLWGRIYREYDDTFWDECMTQTACFGMLFTDDITVAQYGETTDEHMYCGILDENLIGNGQYTHGTDNADNPQLKWHNSNDSTYDPSNVPDIDPNLYNGTMRTRALSTISSATTRYNLSLTSSFTLCDRLWDIMALAQADEVLTDYTLKKFLVNNPIDAIVSLMYFPIKEDMGFGPDTHVNLGQYQTDIGAKQALPCITKDCGDYEIHPKWSNSWIDRETQITLYLPFCGTINLEPDIYMGRKINVEYLIDLTTGNCSAVVSYRPEGSGSGNRRVITDIANGNCAVDLPITGLQQQTLNSQLFNASETNKQLKTNNAFKGFKSITNGISSATSGNAGGVLGTIQDFLNIFSSEKISDYNLQHTMMPMKMIGTNGGMTGAMCELYPTIIFSRPIPAYNDAFIANNGYACCEAGVLGSYGPGYVEVSNIDLSGFSATSTEKSMIQSLLAGGVWL